LTVWKALVLIGAGLVALTLHRRLGTLAAGAQPPAVGLRKSERPFQIAYGIAGVVFMTIGILVLLGVVRFG
jgi:hypothetical protein